MGKARDDATVRERPERLDATMVPAVPAVTEPPDDAAVTLPPRGALPSKIGRFEIESKLGEGGMGVVLLGVDPTLQRRVALKLLHDGAGADGDGRRRLVREAQAVAKVVDEHVIVVHEVVTHGEQVFVAMEYVDGGTLGKWQRGRPWREVLEAYVRAGHGLEAAHAAGLVHRDFKPDNVLVGADGRLRVTDFGLVASVDAPPDAARMMPRAGSELAASLTRTGAVMGTPRFMAPEQHLAETLDARADQFAFCASLYEALYGRPPFLGQTVAVIAANVVAGEVEPIPDDTDVPAKVGAAILRGLSRKREDRFSSMTELLAALDPPAPAKARRSWLPFVAIGWVVVVAAAVWLLRDPASTPLAASAREPSVLGTINDKNTKNAKAKFEEGNRLYAGGKLAEAVTAFEASLRWLKHPTVHFNLAVALAALDRSEEALRNVDEALLYPEVLGDTKLAQARVLRDRLVSRIRDAADAVWAQTIGMVVREGAAWEKAVLFWWASPPTHFALAMTYAQLRQYEDALRNVDAALVHRDDVGVPPASVDAFRMHILRGIDDDDRLRRKR